MFGGTEQIRPAARRAQENISHAGIWPSKSNTAYTWSMTASDPMDRKHQPTDVLTASHNAASSGLSNQSAMLHRQGTDQTKSTMPHRLWPIINGGQHPELVKPHRVRRGRLADGRRCATPRLRFLPP
jgi:hypothetical protein